jgi:aminomethyltransferase
MNFAAESEMGEPRATPLYAAAATACATNSWTSVNGWASARTYTAVEQEHRAASEDAALVDLGPLCRYTVRGAAAAELLARLTTNPVGELSVGESARGLILDSSGAVVDFADVSRLSGDLFLLTSSGPIDRRLQLAARDFSAEVRNIGSMIAAIGVIGPAARDAAAAAGLDILSADATGQGRIRGVELAVRPVNFGAAAGVEIICPAEDALVIWERLRRKRPLQPAGLDALEILRIEGGSPRLGVDFLSADRAPSAHRRLPDEIGLPHLAPPNRAWFNGRRAMKNAPPPRRRLLVLTADGDLVLPGAAVFARSEPAGRVTSTAFSPRLRRAICFAEIEAPAVGEGLLVQSPSGERIAAQLHETPEGRLAASFRDSLKAATDSRR